ncbi:hypothetical protein [Haladaptatus sp. AB643]|uniref:hypothetical protein n=1 Tax=Haladaptatus sp. AB643 TaxID=2934174 RepID=UPI00209BD31F|nr:hypothetical protein [Haladaptatus sp. AB643]MCO8244898.1 hypothetical protein [Haladaptatus sp. AB643]
MASRKNAMLTTEDRRWLTGEKTYDGEHAKQQRYQRRNDIRERVYNSILDFTILFEHLEEAERKKLFGEVTANGRHWDVDDKPFIEGVSDALAFLLYNVDAAATMRTDDEAHEEATVAEELLIEAFYRAGMKADLLVDQVDLDVEAIQLPFEDILADLEAGNELSPAALRVLLESEQVDTATIQEQLRSVVFDDGSPAENSLSQEN